ncbi:MAG: thioester reductase domain-containing protein [Deinococcales bacterium]
MLSDLADPLLGELGFEMETRDLLEHIELKLPPLPAEQASTHPKDWQQLLLTGASGYFGAYLLLELLNRTEADIYCLIRASSNEEARGRLLSNLYQHKPQLDFNPKRLHALAGDLDKPHLGLDHHNYQRLASQIDAIYHAGALVNFAHSFNSLKKTNVEGLKEIFYFASQGKQKAVELISSLHIFSSNHLMGKGIIYEDEVIEKVPSLIGGYGQSRWVAEGIAKLARRQGLRVRIYRPSIIGGDSETGLSNEKDALCRLFKGCIQVGAVPNLSASLNIVPADYAAKAVVALSMLPTLNETYHIVSHAATPLSKLFAWLKEMGYQLEELDYERWRKQIAQEDNALYPLLPIISHLSASAAIGMESPHFDDSLCRERLALQLIICPQVDKELIQHYLRAMVKSGFIPAISSNREAHAGQRDAHG